MPQIDFPAVFKALTGYDSFPWQAELFRLFCAGLFPASCNLPTRIGKTSVIPVWLIALVANPEVVPRRLVYVVNRRTVVDQSTREAESLRERLADVPELKQRLQAMCAAPTDTPLAISTLRGQFADNAEWRSDPARPAIIVGTVDMIGSRLLFNGYGIGYKTKPLQAGFLGQDVLLVHDEAHLEPAFQELLVAIEQEQHRCKEFRTFRVLELSATSRGQQRAFELTDAERRPPNEIPNPPTKPVYVVWRRLKAHKAIQLVPVDDEKKELADKIAELALSDGLKLSGRAILIFAQTVENVEKIVAKLNKQDQKVQPLTGTLRGLTLVGEEYPLAIDGDTFRIDLLFFHRRLQCLIAVDLKIGEFLPEYVGKSLFYVAALDEQVRLPHENPSIGLILCRSAKQVQVRLALTPAAKKIGVATYQTALPDEKLIRQRLEQLPAPSEVSGD